MSDLTIFTTNERRICVVYINLNMAQKHSKKVQCQISHSCFSKVLYWLNVFCLFYYIYTVRVFRPHTGKFDQNISKKFGFARAAFLFYYFSSPHVLALFFINSNALKSCLQAYVLCFPKRLYFFSKNYIPVSVADYLPRSNFPMREWRRPFMYIIIIIIIIIL